MRTIKFRGKSKSTKQWVYGYVREIWASKQEDCRYIICPSMSFENDGFTDSEETEVIPETVGEFSGMTDKNGNDIYENDIVFYDNHISKCSFLKGSFVFGNEFDIAYGHEVEIKGNVFDNAELLSSF